MPDFDHCAEAARLRQKLTDIATGEGVAASRFGADEVRFNKADTTELKKLIAYHDEQCAIQNGDKPKRSRFAMAAKARPY